MKRVNKQELKLLELELENLEIRATELASSEFPDEDSIILIAERTKEIQNLLNYEVKKARFFERGLRLLD